MTKAELLRHLEHVPLNAHIVFGSTDDGLRHERIARAYITRTQYGLAIELAPACGRTNNDDADEGTEELT